ATLTAVLKVLLCYRVAATRAGIFEVANFPDDQLTPLLGIVCPTMLSPYLRATVADVINRTSLPPLHLSEVNFQRLYEQRVAEAQGQQAEQAEQGASDNQEE